MDAIYRQSPWPRYFPCLSNGGHIHATLACHTLFLNTPMAWTPALSGKPVAEAVAELGEALCTVCYPDAPSAWTAKTLTQIERERTAAQRNAAKAEREAARLIKQLADDEIFRTAYDHDKVTTVAACKDLIRRAIEQAVELEFYRSPAAAERWTGDPARLAQVTQNIADNLTLKQADADQAERVLLAREAARPGTGATAGEIAKIKTSKERSARKGWGV
jgi:hypothetical protein